MVSHVLVVVVELERLVRGAWLVSAGTRVALGPAKQVPQRHPALLPRKQPCLLPAHLN